MEYGDSRKFHNALLRPCVTQILRAAGFNSARPFVVDSITDMAGLYLQSLAVLAAENAYILRNERAPDVTDARLALRDRGAFMNVMTAAEEAWAETLRRPLSEFPESRGVRQGEAALRDEEDTKDVTEWTAWFDAAHNIAVNDIRRVAGYSHKGADGNWVEGDMKEDYVAMLKKKHSKTGEESKFQGTVLGIQAEDRVVEIEGGPHKSIAEWTAATCRRSAKLAALEKGKEVAPAPVSNSMTELTQADAAPRVTIEGRKDDDDEETGTSTLGPE